MVEGDILRPSLSQFNKLQRILDLDLVAVREIIGKELSRR